jgi:maltooligosyltrehalose trehalohydrolase
MNFRGSPRGEPSVMLPPPAFVAFIQNHDQVGNRALGERLSSLAPKPALRAIAAVYLLLPQIPMLFMGEEWGARQPFPFFCDFPGELGEAVRKGRREEFARFPEFQDEAARARLPDPQALGTFESAKLQWTDLTDPAHMAWLEWYRRLLHLRREMLVPLLPDIPTAAGKSTVLGAGAIRVSWQAGAGAELSLLANLSDRSLGYDTLDAAETFFQLGDCRYGRLTPWFVRWSLARGDSQ